MNRRLGWAAEHLEEVLGATLLAGMACLAFANVVTRYVVHLPLAFTEELEVNAMVWLTLFGASAAFRKRRHLRLLFFVARLPRSGRRALECGSSLLALGLFTTLGWLGTLQIQEERLLEITSESLGFPQWLYTVSIPVGCALIAVRLLQATRVSWREGG